MGLILEATKEIRDLLRPIIGETQAKIFFSYYAIMKDEYQIGLYKDGKFYLRISKKAVLHTPWVASLVPLEDRRRGIYNKQFYYIPNHILKNPILYSHLVLETLEELKNNKAEKKEYYKTLIRNLPNCNIHIERILKRVAVYQAEDFFATDIYTIFVALIKLGIEVNQHFLYKLYGAANHTCVHLLTPHQKQSILTNANQALYEAGLRRRFNLSHLS